jgi:hypothetical protein
MEDSVNNDQDEKARLNLVQNDFSESKNIDFSPVPYN